MRLDGNREKQSSAATKILAWSKAEKGIDDSLLKGEKLNEITVRDWFSTIEAESRNEALNMWKEIETLNISTV